MAAPSSLIGLLAAVAAGLLVGIERGFSQRAEGEGNRVAGFRTFGLIGLLGGIAGLLGDGLAAVIGLGTLAVLVVGYVRTMRENRLSATTTIAAMLTFGVGLVAVRISPTVALGAAAAMFAILSGRQSMHALLRGLNAEEVEAAARFVLVALVVLPLLPDAAYGPYEAWNPRRIWLVVVFVTGLSFAGYVVTRRYGTNRGILFVALTGAIVSSTAVTAEYARRLRSEPEARGALTAGIALASIVMFVRVQLLVLALVPRALPSLAVAMAPATLVAGLLALIAWRGQETRTGEVTLGNPLSFTPALLLAGLVAVLSLAARWALSRFGSSGIAVVLGLIGVSDVDAAVLTLANLPADALDGRTAGLVLSAPILANTAVKAGMTAVIGWRAGGVRAALPLAASLVASGAALAFWALL
ncbi:DUF4010 domain-containing protein [Novosphingobium sp. NBM11]|uniref:MgtC/SapB family protein n=1 Tax=Novosphingobium sp. NBM11 TaxID=2596914 RepID=UPI0018922BAA|nr:DUF4010 domain-containing protein [Novosphingobium sp. NBM11]MBF5089368.1 DUF4010 domain-containing protein [Novosphingobium sp. NBM11]